MIKEISIIALFVIIFFALFLYGIEKEEARECKIWEEQAETIEGHFWTEWQREQCGK